MSQLPKGVVPSATRALSHISRMEKFVGLVPGENTRIAPGELLSKKQAIESSPSRPHDDRGRAAIAAC